MTNRKKAICCLSCIRAPDEIPEYIDAAREERMTPEEYVVRNEGTYNRSTRRFYCTECYAEKHMNGETK